MITVIGEAMVSLVAVRKFGTVLHRAAGRQPGLVTEFDAAFTGALLAGLHQLTGV